MNYHAKWFLGSSNHMSNKDVKAYFLQAMINFAQEKGISKEVATSLMTKCLKHILYTDPIVQHIGPQYYAYQILMQKHLVPFIPL